MSEPFLSLSLSLSLCVCVCVSQIRLVNTCTHCVRIALFQWRNGIESNVSLLLKRSSHTQHIFSLVTMKREMLFLLPTQLYSINIHTYICTQIVFLCLSIRIWFFVRDYLYSFFLSHFAPFNSLFFLLIQSQPLVVSFLKKKIVFRIFHSVKCMLSFHKHTIPIKKTSQYRIR